MMFGESIGGHVRDIARQTGTSEIPYARQKADGLVDNYKNRKQPTSAAIVDWLTLEQVLLNPSENEGLSVSFLKFPRAVLAANRAATFMDDVAESPCVTKLLVPPPAAFQQTGRKAESHRRRTASCFALHCIQIQRSCWCSP